MKRAGFLIIVLATLWPGFYTQAGLLTEGTRLIYPQGRSSQTITITNTNPWPVLLQSWVDRGEGELDSGETPFVAVPFITRLEPSASQSLRVVYTGEALPHDHESLFWLNLYEIPPNTGAAEAGEARLTLTINTQLKLLYRPKGIGTPETLATQLHFQLAHADGQWCVDAHNPTPWHASLAAVWVEGTQGPVPVENADLLLPPFSRRCFQLPSPPPGMEAEIGFSLIDDGGFSQEYRQPGMGAAGI